MTPRGRAQLGGALFAAVPLAIVGAIAWGAQPSAPPPPPCAEVLNFRPIGGGQYEVTRHCAGPENPDRALANTLRRVEQFERNDP